MLIPIGISNHHVHLTIEDKNILFGEFYQLEKRNDLSQPGNYACKETVTLRYGEKELSNVRIIGPCRKYTQIELLATDAEYFHMDVPYRDSGDLDNTPGITIIGPKGQITTSRGCIIANRHLHLNPHDHTSLNDQDIITVKIDNYLLENVHVKEDLEYKLELHLNKDEAMKYHITNLSTAVIYEKE